MSGKYYSYINPKCEPGPFGEKGGCGVFARQRIKKGELVSLWGGRVLTEAEVDFDMPQLTQRIVQVDEGLYLETPAELEPSDCFNHSCDPNVGLRGQIGLVALRDIQVGEELNLDYAMCDSSSYDEFTCYCGSAKCRGKITGNDWMLPELWDRYAGYFSPYLAKRIEELKAKKTSP